MVLKKTMDNPKGTDFAAGEKAGPTTRSDITPEVCFDWQLLKLIGEDRRMALVIGDKRYLLCSKWFSKVSDFAGRNVREAGDTKQTLHTDIQKPTVINPGPIDNGQLHDENGLLRRDLCEGRDFAVTGSSLWHFLHLHFKMLGDVKTAITGNVVLSGTFIDAPTVNIYPESRRVTLRKNFEVVTSVDYTFSAKDTYGLLHANIRNIYNVDGFTLSRLWAQSDYGSFDPMELGQWDNLPDFKSNQLIVLETIRSNGWWLRPFKPFKSISLESLLPGRHEFLEDAELANRFEDVFSLMKQDSPFFGAVSSHGALEMVESIVLNVPKKEDRAVLMDLDNGMGITLADTNRASDLFRNLGMFTSCMDLNTLATVSNVKQLDLSPLKECFSASTSIMTSPHSESPAIPLGFGDHYTPWNTTFPDVPLPLGVCGLVNDGLTCYQNAALQCMSNVLPLTEYLLHGMPFDAGESAPTNSNARGHLLAAYVNLLIVMWSGHVKATSANSIQGALDLKKRFFKRYEQHDAQEWLCAFLDEIHSDLNKAPTPCTSKTSTPSPAIEGAERSDAELANDAWESFTARDNSIIVDLFYGLSRSMLTCPNCGKVSTKIEPYSTVLLPIVLQVSVQVILLRIDANDLNRHEIFRMDLPSAATAADAVLEISRRSEIDTTHLALAAVHERQVVKIVKPTDRLSDFGLGVELYVYETPGNVGNDWILVPVCLWASEWARYSPSFLFGQPLAIFLPLTPVTNAHVINEIFKKLLPFLTMTPGTTSWLNECHLGEGVDSLQLLPSFGGTDFMSPKHIFKLNVIQNLKEKLEEPVIVPYDDNTFEVSAMDLCVAGNLNLAIKVDHLARSRLWRRQPFKFSINVNNNNKAVHLRDCVKAYVSEEQLDASWKCAGCAESVHPTKKVDFWSLPKYMVIALNRFKMMGVGYTGYTKDCRPVEVPMELDLSDFVVGPHVKGRYMLNSVCNHAGSHGRGHYTAEMRSISCGKWFNISDTVCMPVDDERTVAMPQDVYIAVYQQC